MFTMIGFLINSKLLGKKQENFKINALGVSQSYVSVIANFEAQAVWQAQMTDGGAYHVTGIGTSDTNFHLSRVSGVISYRTPPSDIMGLPSRMGMKMKRLHGS